MDVSDWFKGFEKGIAGLAPEQREQFFHECGKNCVQHGTLQIYQALHEKTGGNLDLFFSEAGKLPGVRSEVVKAGSTYALYFTECSCGLHNMGYVSTPLLCECSRQSILHVLHALWKDHEFKVEVCGSILRSCLNLFV